MTEKCYACNKALKGTTYPRKVKTSDNQIVWVGPDCFQHVLDAGAEGYQPPLGGPRLYGLGFKGVS